MGRPTSFYVQNYENGEAGCAAEKCTAAITSVGNPLIWWAGTLAVLFLIGYWIAKRDWRAGAILAGFAAGFLPWIFYPTRTIFFFYAIAYEPFMILAIVLVLGLILGKVADPPWRRQQGALIVGILPGPGGGRQRLLLPALGRGNHLPGVLAPTHVAAQLDLAGHCIQPYASTGRANRHCAPPFDANATVRTVAFASNGGIFVGAEDRRSGCAAAGPLAPRPGGGPWWAR